MGNRLWVIWDGVMGDGVIGGKVIFHVAHSLIDTHLPG